MAVGAGCTGAGDETTLPTSCDPVAATVEVGTGTGAFEPLSEGQALPFFLGPQGGYHVFAALKATGIEPGDPADPFGPASPVITVELTVEGEVIGRLIDQPRLFEAQQDAAVLVNQRVVMEVLDPPDYDGAAATLSAEVVDRCGSAAEDARGVVLVIGTET